MTFRILAMGGDGIGTEVLDQGIRLIDILSTTYGVSIDITEDFLGGAAYDRFGTFCRDETVVRAKQSDAILVGAVGGPKWDGITMEGGPEMQDGLMRLRKELDCFAGLRPAKAFPVLEDRTPYRPGLASRADIMVLREMCGGAFFGVPRGVETDRDGKRVGFDNSLYTESEIVRIARVGFELARRRSGRLCSVDKANVMQTYVLWREVIREMATEYPDIELTVLYADNAAYQLARNPMAFDVIVGDNLFGDIFSDQAAVVCGSLGMLPSACLQHLPAKNETARGIYEPVHGTAPDIAGLDQANPIGMLLTVAMMAEYSMGRSDLKQVIETAVERSLAEGIRTPDLGGSATSQEVTDAVIRHIRA